MAAPRSCAAGLVDRAVVAHLGRAHVGVGGQAGGGGGFRAVGVPTWSPRANPPLRRTRGLSRPRRFDPRPDGRRWLPAALVAELLERDARDFDVDVDPVEQRAGEALLVAADG